MRAQTDQFFITNSRKNVHHWFPAFLQTGNPSILFGETVGRIHHHISATVRSLSWWRLEVRNGCWRKFRKHQLNEFNFFSYAALTVATFTSPCSTTYPYRWHSTDCIYFTLPHEICWHPSNQCSNSALSNRSSFCHSGKVRMKSNHHHHQSIIKFS